MKNINITLKSFSFFLISTLLIWALPSAKGQGYMLITYDASMPLGNTADYIDNISPRGGSFEAGKYISDRIGLSIKAGWHIFYEEFEKDTYTEDNVTIYGKKLRFINSIPILLNIKYDFEDLDKIAPYAKLGIGGYSFQKRTDLGLNSYVNENIWNLGAQPELGILSPISERIKLNFSVRYNLVLKNASIDHQSYVSICLGFFVQEYAQIYELEEEGEVIEY